MMKKENPSDITSLSNLAIALRKKRKKETLRDEVLKSFHGVTTWDYGKKVVDNGRVVDEEWLKKKLARMQRQGKRQKF